MLINKRYELQQELGQGGMGVVYQAHDRLTQKLVALKRVNASPANLSFNSKTDDADMMLSLAREFRILASLRHPNIIPVLDYGFDDEQHPFFTMQLLDAPQAFFDVAENKNLEQQVAFFIQILQALSYLHQRGIIHRDLKPANILIQDEQVYVLDFGLSVIADVATGRAGTVAYMAPEIVRQAKATKQSDLFAIGIMLYKLLTGEFPYSMASITGMDPFVLKNDAISSHPLELVIRRLISENPGDRYVSAYSAIQALCDAADIAAPIEDERIRESFLQTAPFIGREAELKTLENALEAAGNGQGSIWLIGGESGVGKSRLMEEIRIRALIEGAIVVRSRGVEGGGLPYQLWREPLRRLVLSISPYDFELAVLKELVPDIASLLGCEVKSVSQLNGAAHKQRLLSTITEIFRKQKRAIVLILEDLQWTTESLEPIKHLSQIVQEQALLILGNYRDDERPDIPEIIPNSHSIKLWRLSKDEVASLSVAMLGKAGTAPQVLNLLQRETEGNVFFLVEVVRALVEAAGSRRNVENMTLPEAVFAGGIQTIIQRRLDKVPERYHPLLQLAAVAGRQLDLNILSYAQDLHQEDLDNFILSCANAAVFEVQDGNWHFSHDKLREQLIHNLSQEKRRILHQQVAEAIETIYPDDIAQADRLFEHWREANNADKELVYLAMVIDHLLKHVGDYAHVQHLAKYGLSKLDTDDSRRAYLLNHMSQYMWRTGDYDMAWNYAQQALKIAKQHHALHAIAAAMNNLGNTAYYQGRLELAITYYQHSVDTFKQIGNINEQANNLVNIGWTHCTLGNYDKATDFIQRGKLLFSSAGDSWGIASAHYSLGLVASHQDRYDAAIAHHHKSLLYFRSVSEPWHIALNLVNLGFTYLKKNDLKRSTKTFVEVLGSTRNAGQKGLMLETIIGFAELYYKRGNFARAVALLNNVTEHPALNSDVERHIKPLQQKLEEVLQEDILMSTCKGHQEIDWEKIVQDLLDEFEEETSKTEH